MEFQKQYEAEETVRLVSSAPHKVLNTTLKQSPLPHTHPGCEEEEAAPKGGGTQASGQKEGREQDPCAAA